STVASGDTEITWRVITSATFMGLVLQPLAVGRPMCGGAGHRSAGWGQDTPRQRPREPRRWTTRK
ncbi:MAG TPA: hypothetical protein VK741_09175, partial [Acetobacteraceae bacterium]|nr:hypothetical protein [Acetobacteraceae bacterium]